ncbi:MAG TPA: SMP-30/gluconolactonase/LRE family protein [Candidatus Acidoferrum sp.]|jgi:DNA-binding beta-propeller fold protein YncE
MFRKHTNWMQAGRTIAAIALVLGFVWAPRTAVYADKKKKSTPAAEASKPKVADYSSIVWPNPPAIPRIRYQAWYASDTVQRNMKGNVSKKSGWMDRLAGTQTEQEVYKLPFSLLEPYGSAVDSKGNLYVADQKVGAIFIFNTDTRAVELIKNGVHAHFVRIIGLAMDDNDRLFVSDPGLRHVLVFSKMHKAEDVISEGMVSPGGLAIDTQNRLLYVTDTELDQVLVYDADSFKLIRKMGTTGHKHELTEPGDFAKPTGVAVDREGNLYVADTWNNRIEIFDADGKLISTFGKEGDGPGYFGRPKGVAIDSDGHIWVADGIQDRVQVFNREGQLLIAIGGHGLLPGQFQGLVGITIDKNNRVFTTEMFPGRAQQFLYVTDAQAEELKKQREAERSKGIIVKTVPEPATPTVPAASAATPHQ